jgi:hypothetical protein
VARHEAVAIDCELARARTEAFLPGLATALHNQSNALLAGGAAGGGPGGERRCRQHLS